MRRCIRRGHGRGTKKAPSFLSRLMAPGEHWLCVPGEGGVPFSFPVRSLHSLHSLRCPVCSKSSATCSTFLRWRTRQCNGEWQWPWHTSARTVTSASSLCSTTVGATSACMVAVHSAAGIAGCGMERAVSWRRRVGPMSPPRSHQQLRVGLCRSLWPLCTFTDGLPCCPQIYPCLHVQRWRFSWR